jgi:hypothetical protein
MPALAPRGSPMPSMLSAGSRPRVVPSVSPLAMSRSAVRESCPHQSDTTPVRGLGRVHTYPDTTPPRSNHAGPRPSQGTGPLGTAHILTPPSGAGPKADTLASCPPTLPASPQPMPARCGPGLIVVLGIPRGEGPPATKRGPSWPLHPLGFWSRLRLDCPWLARPPPAFPGPACHR